MDEFYERELDSEAEGPSNPLSNMEEAGLSAIWLNLFESAQELVRAHDSGEDLEEQLADLADVLEVISSEFRNPPTTRPSQESEWGQAGFEIRDECPF